MIPAFPQFTEGQSGAFAQLNELLDSLAAFYPLTVDHENSGGFVLAFFGGRWAGADRAAQSITLPASVTSYVEANTTTGAVTSNTSGYSVGALPLGIAVTNTTSLFSYTQEYRGGGGGGTGTGVSLSAVNVFTKNQSVAPVVLTDAATIVVDASLSNNFRVTLGGNRTIANPTNLTDGMVFNLKVKQDATGTRTLAYGSKYKWPAGTVPVLSTAANAIDFFSAYYDSADDILICNMLKAIA